MELLADRDPEEARQLLDPVLERMMEAVHRYEGTVNQVMGDGIMALFGAPLAHEDHAVRACYAALRMQETRASATRDEVQRAARACRVQIRVGLNSGEVVVRVDRQRPAHGLHRGRADDAPGRPHGADGRPGLASCSPRDTLRTRRRATSQVQAARPGPGQGPQRAGRRLRADRRRGPARTRAAGRRRAEASRRFVGRDAELDQLRDGARARGAGHGQVGRAWSASPGVGKSRLVWELTHSHRTQGWLVLEIGSVSLRQGDARTCPIIELLKAYFGSRSATTTARRSARSVTGKLLHAGPTACSPPLPALGSSLDVPVDDPAGERLDPPTAPRSAPLDAVKRLLLRESQRAAAAAGLRGSPLARRRDSQALLDSPGGEPALRTALLLLVNYRPEYRHDWGSKTYHQQLRLDPLARRASAEALARRAASGPRTALAPHQVAC